MAQEEGPSVAPHPPKPTAALPFPRSFAGERYAEAYRTSRGLPSRYYHGPKTNAGLVSRDPHTRQQALLANSVYVKPPCDYSIPRNDYMKFHHTADMRPQTTDAIANMRYQKVDAVAEAAGGVSARQAKDDKGGVPQGTGAAVVAVADKSASLPLSGWQRPLVWHPPLTGAEYHQNLRTQTGVLRKDPVDPYASVHTMGTRTWVKQNYTVPTIPGFTGHVPGKESEPICGVRYKKANEQAADFRYRPRTAVPRRTHRPFAFDQCDDGWMRESLDVRPPTTSGEKKVRMQLRDHMTKPIPGYTGFIPARYAENVHGSTYTHMTSRAYFEHVRTRRWRDQAKYMPPFYYESQRKKEMDEMLSKVGPATVGDKFTYASSVLARKNARVAMA
ncbi:unnamed protein product [Vitrella brassicaformis CCMP3155]|uniref:Uncharacterized protein n=1 Tax=Vitrella brassicaformis (strain CCMP3155) TaxID=1169540 RepID=A0A0G4ENJ5_VITBC|nr:unnamed protein product [Vitrella brassicaformis CCMP3155]|eukprot:CEL98427.1 unnamed protein product [Vitrella brassicaformis CCMP3155]